MLAVSGVIAFRPFTRSLWAERYIELQIFYVVLKTTHV